MFSIAGPGGFGKTCQQDPFLGQGHVLALASTARLGFERLEPAAVIGHVRPVHRAQRHTHRFGNRRLGSSRFHAAAPSECAGAAADSRSSATLSSTSWTWPLVTFDHLFLRIRWSQRITPRVPKTIHSDVRRPPPKTSRFNKLWKRYEKAHNRKPCFEDLSVDYFGNSFASVAHQFLGKPYPLTLLESLESSDFERAALRPGIIVLVTVNQAMLGEFQERARVLGYEAFTPRILCRSANRAYVQILPPPTART